MALTAIADLHRFLLGRWRLERTIVGDEATPSGSFHGAATFVPEEAVPGLLRYHERGTVRLGDHRGPASRRLGYHVEGPVARVVFADGRSFHDLDLRHGAHEVTHRCGADRYRGRFEVLDADTWRATWTVTGPAKDHRIVTVHRRLARR